MQVNKSLDIHIHSLYRLIIYPLNDQICREAEVNMEIRRKKIIVFFSKVKDISHN